MSTNATRFLYFVATSLMFFATLTACQRGQTQDIEEINLDLAVAPNPPAVGPAMLTLDLSDANNQPITGAAIDLEGNMSHAGMTPVFAEATEVEPGRYEAPLEFTMGGDWFIVVLATLPDGRQLERQIDLPGVEANGG